MRVIHNQVFNGTRFEALTIIIKIIYNKKLIL